MTSPQEILEMTRAGMATAEDARRQAAHVALIEMNAVAAAMSESGLMTSRMPFVFAMFGESTESSAPTSESLSYLNKVAAAFSNRKKHRAFSVNSVFPPQQLHIFGEPNEEEYLQQEGTNKTEPDSAVRCLVEQKQDSFIGALVVPGFVVGNFREVMSGDEPEVSRDNYLAMFVARRADSVDSEIEITRMPNFQDDHKFLSTLNPSLAGMDRAISVSVKAMQSHPDYRQSA